MANIEITIDDEHIEAISQGNGLEVLLKQVLDEILDAEMTDHLRTDKHKRTDEGCVREFKKSTVSNLCEGLDEQVEGWNERSLDDRGFPFILVDAMHTKVRRQGAVRSTSAMVIVGITRTATVRSSVFGSRTPSHAKAGWRRFGG